MMSSETPCYKFSMSELVNFKREGKIIAETPHTVFDEVYLFSVENYEQALDDLLGINHFRGEKKDPNRADIYIKKLDFSKTEGKVLKAKDVEKIFSKIKYNSNWNEDESYGELYLFEQVLITIDNEQRSIRIYAEQGEIENLKLKDIVNFMQAVIKIAKKYGLPPMVSVCDLSIEYYKKKKKLGEIKIQNEKTELYGVELKRRRI